MSFQVIVAQGRDELREFELTRALSWPGNIREVDEWMQGIWDDLGFLGLLKLSFCEATHVQTDISGEGWERFNAPKEMS